MFTDGRPPAAAPYTAPIHDPRASRLARRRTPPRTFGHQGSTLKSQRPVPPLCLRSRASSGAARPAPSTAARPRPISPRAVLAAPSTGAARHCPTSRSDRTNEVRIRRAARAATRRIDLRRRARPGPCRPWQDMSTSRLLLPGLAQEPSASASPDNELRRGSPRIASAGSGDRGRLAKTLLGRSSPHYGLGVRSILARAGETRSEHRGAWHYRDPSPRVRGKRFEKAWEADLVGSIDPRVRGETVRAALCPARNQGPSPRVRRETPRPASAQAGLPAAKPEHQRARIPGRRSIRPRGKLWAVSGPKRRGASAIPAGTCGGNDPLDTPRRRRKCTSIPARAGETRATRRSRCRTTVHPRACGGNASEVIPPPNVTGPSPRVRGKLDTPKFRGLIPRSIPARAAGNHRAATQAQADQGPSPPTCGGNWWKSWVDPGGWGPSSANVRGKRAQQAGPATARVRRSKLVIQEPPIMVGGSWRPSPRVRRETWRRCVSGIVSLQVHPRACARETSLHRIDCAT